MKAPDVTIISYTACSSEQNLSKDHSVMSTERACPLKDNLIFKKNTSFTSATERR